MSPPEPQTTDTVIDLSAHSGINGSLILSADTDWRKVAAWFMEGKRSYQEYLWLQNSRNGKEVLEAKQTRERQIAEAET